MNVRGIHHVTAMASDPARNVAFYTRMLGLRLVKRTVNFDDPYTWHLYYGDERGSPGTILTFFPWLDLARGRHGAGQAVEVSFAIPPSAFGFWLDRLTVSGLRPEGPMERFGAKVLRFRDPDGLQIEIVTDAAAGERPGRPSAEIPEPMSLRGLHSVSLWVEGYERTAQVLTQRLGFSQTGREENRFRFAVAGSRSPGAVVDIRCVPGFVPGAGGAGIVHHVAFRAADEADEADLRAALVADGHDVTPPIDRSYFRSLYFREPGGILFEIATDPPGFALDEPEETMGSRLMLPPRYEPLRERIARLLPPLEPPAGPDEPFDYRVLDRTASGADLTLLMLHGTGGDETDLLDFAEAVAPGAAVLAPRGRVMEAGAARFFRRQAEGVLDREDLIERADELAAFIARARDRHGLPRRVVAIGYSNGANIASALLYRHPGLLAGAALTRPMILPIAPSGDLAGTPVLVLAGSRDHLVPTTHAASLSRTLSEAGAVVETHDLPAGHYLGEEDGERVKEWLAGVWVGA